MMKKETQGIQGKTRNKYSISLVFKHEQIFLRNIKCWSCEENYPLFCVEF